MSPMKWVYLCFSFYSQQNGSPESGMHFPRSPSWFFTFDPQGIRESCLFFRECPPPSTVRSGWGRGVAYALYKACTHGRLHPLYRGLPLLWVNDWSPNHNTKSPFSKSLARNTTSGFHCSWVCEKRLSRKEWPAGCPSLEKLMVLPSKTIQVHIPTKRLTNCPWVDYFTSVFPSEK